MFFLFKSLRSIIIKDYIHNGNTFMLYLTAQKQTYKPCNHRTYPNIVITIMINIVCHLLSASPCQVFRIYVRCLI